MCQGQCRGQHESKAGVELAYRCMLLRRCCLHDVYPSGEDLRYRFYALESEEVQQLG